jgi:YbbR domain-containing protein
MIVSGLSVACGVAPGVGKTLTITVCKNAATGASLSNPTSITVTITGTATTGGYWNTTSNFATGDLMNVYFTTDSTTLADVSVQVDCF